MKRTWEDWYTPIFILLIGLYLAPIWIFQYFPSQDSPSHLENAKIILDHYLQNGSINQQYYLINHNLIPNLITYPLLSFLLIFFPILVAEKIVLSLFVIFCPLSIRYVLNSINPDSNYISLFTFPFIYNYTFQIGFLNYSYSIIILLIILGYFVRCYDDLNATNILLLFVLSIALFFSHPLSLAMLYIFIVIYQLTNVLINSRDGKKTNIRINWLNWRWLKNGLKIFIAFLPSIILFINYLLQQERGKLVWVSPLELVANLFSVSSIVLFDSSNIVIAIMLGIFFILLMIYCIKQKITQRYINPWDGILAIIFLLYFLAPNEMGSGSVINLRINLLIWLVIILWLGANYRYYKPSNIFIIYIMIVSLSLLSFVTVKYAEYNVLIKDYMLASNFIKNNSTLVRIFSYKQNDFPSGKEGGHWRVNFLIHADSYIAAEKNVVSFNNYEAIMGYFPVLYKKSSNKFNGKSELNLEDLNLLSGMYYNTNDPDYIIIIFGLNEEKLDQKTKLSNAKLVNSNYHLIYSSNKYSVVRLYQKNSYPD
jgi:hypothetical protein